MNLLQQKLDKIEEFFNSDSKFAIAFSGGMDSSLLALLAKRNIPERYVALLVISEFMAKKEIEIAERTAEKFGLKLEKVKIEVLNDELVCENSSQRCYYCKKTIFSRLKKEAQGAVLCDGSVVDDNDDFRPGKKALAELDVESPLLKAGFTKYDVSLALEQLGAAELVRPAQSCLATRIETNSVINRKKLEQIEAGEELIRDTGLNYFRLRHHQDVARIEVPQKLLHEALDRIGEISQDLQALGFKHVALDVDGYQKGSMNRP